MYEYHLWIVLSESTAESDEGGLLQKLGRLRSLVRDTLHPAPAEAVHAVNYQHVLQCSVARNHRGDSHERLMAVLTWITTELPGSHGLVYWYDDEPHEGSLFDGFRVIVLARGQLAHRYDPFLSPLVPVVEDRGE